MLLFVLACSDNGLQKGADTDTAAAVDEVCPSYSGFHATGQLWSWDWPGAYYDTSSATLLSALEDGVVTVHESLTAVGTADGYTGNSETDFVYQCDESGLSLVSSHAVGNKTSTAGAGYDTDYVADTTYDPPWLLVPWDMDSGTTWDVAYAVTFESDAWGSSTSGYVGTYAVEDHETVEVGAGTYTTLEIDGAGTTTGATWSDHTYRDADVGLVMNDSVSLAGVSP